MTTSPFTSGIDHLAILVSDIEFGRKQYEKLGFTLTERAFHQRFGTCNHTFVFERDYCELLSVYQPLPANQKMQQVISSYNGLWLIVMATSDPSSVYQYLQKHHIGAFPPRDYSRKAFIEGKEHTARFSSVELDNAWTPGAYMTICQQKTPQLVWRPEWQSHANGVTGIASITLVAQDIETVRAQYATLFGEGNISLSGNGEFNINTGKQPIMLKSLDSFQELLRRLEFDATSYSKPHLGQLSLRCKNIEETESFFMDHNIPYRKLDSALFVAPELTSGVLMVFCA